MAFTLHAAAGPLAAQRPAAPFRARAAPARLQRAPLRRQGASVIVRASAEGAL